MVRRRPLRLLAVALGAVLIAVWAIACEGDTFRMHLTNDTPEALQYRSCSGENCENPHIEALIQPGDDYPASAALGRVFYWQLRTEAGKIVGCFKIDFPHERPDPNVLYVSKDLVPCPE